MPDIFMIGAFVIVILCLLFEAFFAAAELSIISSNALELEALNQAATDAPNESYGLNHNLSYCLVPPY